MTRMTALQKAIAVTEALAHERRLSDIARHTGLPVSTVHRILQELVTAGWAREEEGRTYVLGARLLSLPSRTTGSEDLARLARPQLRRLCEESGRTVHFAMLDGDQLVYVDKLEGTRAYAMRSRIGMTLPLHCTAIGKAVLAQLPDAEVRQVARRAGLPPLTPRTMTDATVLLRHLAKVRTRSFAVDDEENEPHTRCVGAAVVNHRGEPIGGVSVSSLAFDVTGAEVEELGSMVARTAAAISTAIGGPDSALPPGRAAEDAG
ncbi:IclR family transcriptional regulator [Knoellia remsis]|uniref:IclR family transcriptional regulator n=1 Tax=Knoellia remsis TaxID=407159 RepID=A0A2T0UJY5_9MICO|nr:IclR family transcriptional regulator [Knoellia remsis]PRY58240.1 IclR family transcriptional regulator [Knoellia remsis]